MHTVTVIDPSIEVSKTGPETGKVGDEVTYTICLNNPVGPIENCTGSDNVLGDLGGFSAGGECKDFMYTLPGTPGQVTNTATITCDIPGFDNKATANDMHTVDVIDPSIEVSKTGPETGKVGDEVTYTICLNNPVGPIENCTGSDNVLGDLGGFSAGGECKDFMYTLPGTPGQVTNTATITCDIPGFDNKATANDMHTVDVIDPSIEVSKTGPETGKVGDEVTYTICLNNPVGPIENCTGSDNVLGDLGGFSAGGECKDFMYTLPGTPGQVTNTATITCDIPGFDNKATANDMHTVDVIDPSIEVSKTGPETGKVGDEVTYTICLNNPVGPIENCTGSDNVLGDLGGFSAGGECKDFMYTLPGTPGQVTNTATITCDIPGFDNKATANDMHTVDVIDPSIEVSKTGPETGKVGDEVTYTICLNNPVGPIENCTGSDNVLGDLGGFSAGGECKDFMYTLPGTPGQVTNTATITCDIPGFDNKATANDMHTVDVIDPSIEVSKTGPETGKVGDEVTYTICLNNPVGPIENCTGDDNVLGDLGGFDAGGECKDFMYTLPESPGPVENTATITCDIPGFDNKATANDMHTVDVIDPSIEVSKTGPETGKVGDEVTYTICLNNPVGPIENCTGDDNVLGDLGGFDAGGRM